MKFDIAISIPSHGAWENDFALNVSQLLSFTAQQLPEVVVRLHTAASSMLLQNRYALVQMAKEQGCTHMLWLDDDHTFPEDALMRLLAHDKDIVGANYVTRKPPYVPVACVDGNKRLFSHGKTGLQQADHIGLGMCLTKMEVFERLKEPYFYFGWSPKAKEFIGEDVWFFREARAAGYELWVDHDLSNEVGHLGKFEFTHEFAAKLAEQ